MLMLTPPPWVPCLAEQGFKASNTARYLHLPASPTQARPLAPRQAAFPLGPRLSALVGVGVHSREQKVRVLARDQNPLFGLPSLVPATLPG